MDWITHYLRAFLFCITQFIIIIIQLATYMVHESIAKLPCNFFLNDSHHACVIHRHQFSKVKFPLSMLIYGQ